MYIPAHFAETDSDQLLQLIRERGFGLLITASESGPQADHLPFFLTDDGRLQCHVARSNPVWQQLQAAPRVLVVFEGPDAYISPNWYPTKQETGKVVPTWNYQVVHAHGRATPMQDATRLRQHLENLTNHNERGRPEPWAVSDAPDDYIDKMMGAIVGLEITIDRLEGKTKASQNQPERNRLGVKAGLSDAGTESAAAMSRKLP